MMTPDEHRNFLSGEYTFKRQTPSPLILTDAERQGWPLVVDPADCGCTECLIGQYVPLDQASAVQIRGLFDGYGPSNNTGLDSEELRLYADATFGADSPTARLPKAVDPAGCGCTDCLTGFSVPLDSATREALDNILYGNRVANRTGLSFQQIKDFIWSECGD
jgi:hypothetical protein